MTSFSFHQWLERLRDQEGKGITGCLLFLLFIAIAAYVGVAIGPIYYANSNFESDVKTEASRAGAHFLSDEEVVKDILALSEKHQIRLSKEDIKVERFAGQVHISIKYAAPIDLPVFKRNIDFEIKASSFIGTL